jgi:hypothetical protein
MCLNYLFMQRPDKQQPSLNTIDQQLHLKNHAKWTSGGHTRGVKANGPYIEPSGNFQKIPQIFQMTITHGHDEISQSLIFSLMHHGISDHGSLEIFRCNQILTDLELRGIR